MARPHASRLSGVEWKAGNDGRRTHVVLGFEQSPESDFGRLCDLGGQTPRSFDRYGPQLLDGERARRHTLSMHASLWAPWRLAYLRTLDQQASSAGGEARAATAATAAPGAAGAPGDGDFLRAAWERPDLDLANHVVERTAEGLILLNRYPYANGHLLVALGAARSALLDYDPAQRAAFWKLVDRAVDLCRRALEPQGVNIGVNEGRAAGAGVPTHLHAHVVPRWAGDTNFMTVVGDVRVIPDSLERMAEGYRAAAAAG